MILHPRQSLLVERSLAALRQHGNTLAVAPTGSGKTVMLSAVVGNLLAEPDAKACILAHRDELTAQNRQKFARVNPEIPTSVFNAQEKSWGGRATFAMVQTLARDMRLATMPALDLLVIDEAHHAASVTYRRVIDAVRDRNPGAYIFGVTATPMRSDGKRLRAVFDNVADQITLGELIAAGHLVRPRTFVIDVGAQAALQEVRRTAGDFDMHEAAAILDQTAITDAVITHWREKAGDRQTIVFCSTVDHARHVTQAFVDAGIRAVLVHGELPEVERQSRLRAYEAGDAQVVVNVAVLTEGYDFTPTACVILLRPSSHSSTMIQMIGRGLRTVDPAEHPDVIKTDCIVLDFGNAVLTHGTLEQHADLRGHACDEATTVRQCPDCQARVPLACRSCPLCGASFQIEVVSDQTEAVPGQSDAAGDKVRQIDSIPMTEIDLLNRSNFQWCDLFGDDQSHMAAGLTAWSGVFFLDGHWHAVGGGQSLPTRLLAVGDRYVCMAQADDWINTHETGDTAHKMRHWLRSPATDKQLRYLPPALRNDYGLTRYQASARLAFTFNKPTIHRLVSATRGDHSRIYS